MDWSKAKNILIIALLITNLILGGCYVNSTVADRRTEESAADNMKQFLELNGASVDVPIPTGTKKLPVVFVEIASGDGEAAYYNGYRIEASGADAEISPIGGGEAGAETITASEALAKLVSRLGTDSLDGLEFKNIELVYWLDLGGMDAVSSQDTAVPAWRFDTSGGVFYIDAFAE